MSNINDNNIQNSDVREIKNDEYMGEGYYNIHNECEGFEQNNYMNNNEINMEDGKHDNSDDNINNSMGGITNMLHVNEYKKIKSFCKLRRKFVFMRRTGYNSYIYNRKKKKNKNINKNKIETERNVDEMYNMNNNNNNNHNNNNNNNNNNRYNNNINCLDCFSDLFLKFIKQFIDHINVHLNNVKNYYRSYVCNDNMKYVFYLFIIYMLLNIMIIFFSMFVYFFLYFYFIPQNKYVFPIDFSLVKNPIEDYLQNEKRYNIMNKMNNMDNMDNMDNMNHINYMNNMNHHHHHNNNKNNNYNNCNIKNNCNNINMMKNFDKSNLNESEDFYIKYFDSLKVDILNSIKNKFNCCCSHECNWFNNILYDKDYNYDYNYNIIDEESRKRNDYLYYNKLKGFYKDFQNNILRGHILFQNKLYYSEKEEFYKNFNPFNFIFFFKKRTGKDNLLNIKKGYKIDIFLNFSYMNNEYNDKFNFIQLVTEIFNKNNNVMFRNEKLYMNNNNYEFIKKLHLFLNAPFYFFNMFNNKTKEIRLVHDYKYTTNFYKIQIYIYPPIQIHKASIVILVYVNFIYYYMYNYPFVFFYIFVFFLSFILIFFNTILFFILSCYYYFKNGL
ncbi:conserved Plasmodium protein, unknown function [Plasmodium reichenowi]|uniref:Seipin domain-containing protein n=2 Tax=Plasmodium (Laverania) TaxID=418107 RepID=A0A060RMW5_PLARE|nr:conserved Plasmodium protein, unknown function [Plasmodium reichenowi]